MPQLDTSTFYSQLFWLCICFLTVYITTRYLLTPRIVGIFTSRQQQIASKLHEAELAIANCRRLNEELGEMIMQAKLQAVSICHHAKSEAAALIKKEQLKIEKKLQLKESNEINKILIYKDEILATIPETSAIISREILEKIKTFYDSKDNTIN